MIGAVLRRLSRTDPETPLGRLVRLPLGLVSRDALLPVVTGELRGMRWTVGASTLGCWLGTYEHEKQALFARSVRPGACVWDVGANAGFYTLLAARLTGPGGSVHAFEPLPRNVSVIRRHVDANALANVTVHETALADRMGRAGFDPLESHEMGRLSEGGALAVAVTTADHLLRHGGVDPPDVIKIDVEGAEAEVLEGARECLERHRPRLFVALHHADTRRRTLESLDALGYRVRAVDEQPLERAKEIEAWHPGTHEPADRTDGDAP